MRCCTPETVVATLNGWQGTNIPSWVFRVWGATPPVTNGYADVEIGPLPCAYETGTTGCHYYYALEWDGTQYVVSSSSTFLECYDVVWPSIAFPQKVPETDAPGYYTCPPGEVGEYYVSAFPSDAVANQKCDGAAALCVTPDAGVESIVYGPSAGTGQQRTFLTDYSNGSYVCHRLKGDMRPEFRATVNRSVAGTDEDIDARLVFDVFCRRNWVFSGGCQQEIIVNLTCAVSDNPPQNAPGGDWYCIDYRCGPRLPAYAEEPGICEQYKCTAHEGMVWPHLFAFAPEDNYTASLRLILEPDYYYRNTEFSYQAAKPQKAMSWRVADVKILSAGSGYEVGDLFKVDFDPYWVSALSGGEIMFVWPDNDADCFNAPITWRDKYGNGPEIDINGVKRYYQTLRVMKVDEYGGILELEIVPWFRDPEFLPNACPETVPEGQRTPHYPGYARNICHPNSVDIGGTGYHINDTITFTPISPGVETYSEAIAKVVDVDDDGAVLDWEINGSDIWHYGFGLGRPICSDLYNDERGAYKWSDKVSLCYLHWEGRGVPVRQATSYDQAGGILYSWANTGDLTTLQITILRVPCRTSINVNVDIYKYDARAFEVEADSEEASLTTRLLKKYPPYPKCFGGGAQITPVIGTDGANESEIGGPLTGGQVKSGGDYYAFTDKAHVQPILPKAIPAIGGGSGGLVDFFTFGEVLNFPRSGYASAEEYVPAANRFAYFPVTGAVIADGGSGYEVGQEFDVKPEQGVQWSHPWRKSGGDDPDSVPNGSWYETQQLNSAGYIPLDIVVNGVREQLEQGFTRNGVCRLRVAAVDANGAITQLTVVHGGLMFRPIWTTGVRHPDVWVSVNTDTGYGAKATVVIDTNTESETYGEVTSCSIVQIPVGEMQDPLHSTQGNPVAMPLGGRDYANPQSGMMWELQDIEAGLEYAVVPARLLSHLTRQNLHGWVRDPYHPSNSSHDLVEGSNPPFYPRSYHCTLNECYHGLLNKTYPMFRAWSGMSVNRINVSGSPGNSTSTLVDGTHDGCPGAHTPPNTYSPLPDGDFFVSGRPKGSYGVFRIKNKTSNVYAAGPEGVPCDENNVGDWQQRNSNVADTADYVVIEHGYSISLSAVIPVYPNCPDHDNGRTSP